MGFGLPLNDHSNTADEEGFNSGGSLNSFGGNIIIDCDDEELIREKKEEEEEDFKLFKKNIGDWR